MRERLLDQEPGSSLRAPAIDNVLYYGYDPACDCKGLQDVITTEARVHPISAGYPRLVQMTQAALRNAVDAELCRVGTERTHFVPLSGGLDSRAVLGSLLNHPDVRPSQIRAATFGTPGTWDFEIAKQVADTAGVRHTTVDIRPDRFDWSVESLRAFARTQSVPVPMYEAYANAQIASAADSDAVFWSGFLGGTTAGEHVQEAPLRSWETAVTSFVESNAYTSDLTSDGYDPRTPLPSEPYVRQSHLPYLNQLSFVHRQRCYIGPVVLGGEDCCCPFSRPEWLGVTLNVPREYRANRRLFIDAMSKAFPDLFAIRTDANGGFPLSVPGYRRTLRLGRLRLTERLAGSLGFEYDHPDMNYINFERWFRRGELHDTARTLLVSLDRRDVAEWVRPLDIWNAHQAGRDRSRDIQALCSLELALSER